MFDTDSYKWSRLDNAAKIFAPTSTNKDPRVFRFACELAEPIDPAILQDALDRAIEDFPVFHCVMRRGLFWHYLEECDTRPIAEEENKQPCAPIYDKKKLGLLFRVSFYKNRINLEMYHVLSDGTGALQFLKTIVYYYLTQKYGADLEKVPTILDYDASRSQKSSDSFRKYYNKKKKAKTKNTINAYQLKGREDGQLHIISGQVSVQELLDAAHSYDSSITGLLTGILISVIHDEMPVQSEKHPVVISIPVNLRKYFASGTARNFFGMINVSYSFKERSGEFHDIMQVVNDTFREELTKEKLSIRMNNLASLEHNFLVKIAPLPFKNFVLRIARWVSDLGVSAVISNIGRISLPKPLLPFIRLFDIFISTRKTQLCLCSFEDNIMLTFSSSFTETDIQMRFFRMLSQLGLEVEITANDYTNQQEQ